MGKEESPAASGGTESEVCEIRVSRVEVRRLKD